MDNQSPPETKRQSEMQLLVSHTLLYGLLASTVIIVIGLVLMAVTNSTGYACDSSGDALNCILSFNPLSSSASIYPTTLASVISGVLQTKPFAIIELGVIVLLATPVLRVFNSLILFGLERDRSFVLITLFVLGVLLFSFFIVPSIPIFKA
ncbi:MAG TPA: DUF1634 domain-containing protein [Nitrososphaerales archaeon]|nr:DUF1634 domain-containing protein [Nitrososphaerales archaeon]